MRLSIDRLALQNVEQENDEATNVLRNPSSSALARERALEVVSISPRRVLEVVCRCIIVEN